MNMKLYGICFKLRGGPDLLDYVQSDTPVPVDLMTQVITEMGSVTQEEMEFAEKLDRDWKKAFNERVPLLMNRERDGSYDITCEVPDELMATISLVTGMENEKILEEYTLSYLKDVCGIDAPIESVDIEGHVNSAVQEEATEGFDLSDLTGELGAPELEDVSELADIAAMPDEPEEEEGVPIEGPGEGEELPVAEMPIEEEIPEEELPAEELPMEELPVEKPETEEIPDKEPAEADEIPMEEDYIPDEEGYDGEVPIEEGYPEAEGFPDIDEGPEEELPEEDEIPAEEPEAEEPIAEGSDMGKALTDIYTELVGNIKEKKLDERLGLRIG